MVLGFGRGPERFPAAKEQTPGPGAYDPKDLETKLPPKSGFLTGERFTSQELEGGNPALERPEPSPPRERKLVNPSNDRSYAWTTQRMHELNKEVEAAKQRIKDLEKQLKERGDKAEKVKKDLAAALEQRDLLQSKLNERDQELALVNGELSSTNEQLRQLSSREAKASKSAQAGAARIEQLLLDLQQVRSQAADASKQLEQHKKDAEEERKKAETAHGELMDLRQQLNVEVAERIALRDRVTSLEEQCRQQAAELCDQTTKRVEAEHRVERGESDLAATREDLQQALCDIGKLQADAVRSSDDVKRLHDELVAAGAQSAIQCKQLGAIQAEFLDVQQRNQELSSLLKTKEASMESISAQMAVQMSDVYQLRVDVNNLREELAAAQEGVRQRDESIATFTTRVDELTQQLAEQTARLAGELHQRRCELEAAGAREQALSVLKAQLEQNLADSVALCGQHARTASSLQQQLESVQADLAAQVEAKLEAAANLEGAQEIIGKQAQKLEEQSVRLAGLEGEVAALTADAEQQAQSSAARIEKLQTQLSAKDAEATQLAAELASGRAALAARVVEIGQLTHAMAERDSIVASLQSHMVELKAEVARRDSQIAEMESDAHQLRSAVTELETSVAGLHATLAQRDAALGELTAERQEANAMLQNCDARILQLSEEAEAAADAASATAELVNTLEASLSKAKANVNGLKHRVSELEASNEQIQRDLNARLDTCTGLSTELAAAKSREVTLQGQFASTERQLATEQAAKQHLQLQCEQLGDELVAAREAHDRLSRSYQELASGEAAVRSALQEQRELNAREGTSWQQRLAEVEGELAAKFAALGAAQKEAEELRKDLQDANEVSEKQGGELARAQADLANTSAVVNNLQCALSNLERRAADIEGAKEKLSQSLLAVQQDLAQSSAQCSCFMGRVAELEAVLAEAAVQRARLQSALEALRNENLETCARAKADAEKANARVAALEDELAESRLANVNLGSELAQLITDLEERGQEIKELKVARHETSSALTAVTAERADLHSQLEDLRRRDMDLQADLAIERARTAQLEAETQSLQSLVTAANDEAHLYRCDAEALSADLDKARDQIRVLELQEAQMEGLRQELESMCVRLRDAETRNEELQDTVIHMESRVASMTPLLSKAKLDDQVRALSDALEKSHLRSSELEDQVRRNKLLETTAALELRRLTDDNEHLVARMMKLEDDLKEQAALGHNNHKQKIQYHLRLKQELEELRHECTVLLRDKFQLEQCIRYLAVQVGVGPEDRRQSMATAERKAIEKVLPACLTYNAIYSTPLSQRAMRLSARGKHNEQGTVYAGGKETFEEGINEARNKIVNMANHWRNDAQIAASAVSPPVAEAMDGVTMSSGGEIEQGMDGCTRSDTCGSPDGKAARPPLHPPAALLGTPVATIRGMGTPVPTGSGATNAGASHTLSKLEERIKQLISDVCAPATSRNPVGPPSAATGAIDIGMVGGTAATVTMTRGGVAATIRDRDQDKGGGGASGINGGASGSSGGASGSNGGGVGGNGAGRERAPRPSMAPAARDQSGVGAQQNRRLTTAPGGRTVFKS